MSNLIIRQARKDDAIRVHSQHEKRDAKYATECRMHTVRARAALARAGARAGGCAREIERAHAERLGDMNHMNAHGQR